jgi:hypothetical protein
MFASTQNPPEAIRFVNSLVSQWDGDMKHELATWGYKEDVSDPDGECEIGALQPMLDELKLSKVNNLHGGPNHCFSVFHADSDIVEKDPQGRITPRKKQYYTANGRKYRVSLFLKFFCCLSTDTFPHLGHNGLCHHHHQSASWSNLFPSARLCRKRGP